MRTIFTLLLVVILAVGFACSKDEDPFADIAGPDSAAEAQNMDGKLLKEMLDKTKRGDFGKILAIIIVRNDEVVVEEYFRGLKSRDLQQTFSATKSIASILLGIAIDKGYIESSDSRLYSFFPEYSSFANYDSVKASLTLKHVLTMTSGYEWDEDLFAVDLPDWIKYVLDLPVIYEPGTHFQYNSGASGLLSVVIQNATGKKTDQFAREVLFEPLNVFAYSWAKGTRNELPEYSYTSAGLALRAMDLANIGVMLLNNGRRGEQQIVSEAWITESTRSYIRTAEDGEYAYLWWRFTDSSEIAQSLAVNDVYFAWGAAGQFLFVIPHLNMVVVSMADNTITNGEGFFDVLQEYILGAVKD